jgi:hypothetical protein
VSAYSSQEFIGLVRALASNEFKTTGSLGVGHSNASWCVCVILYVVDVPYGSVVVPMHSLLELFLDVLARMKHGASKKLNGSSFFLYLGNARDALDRVTHGALELQFWRVLEFVIMKSGALG